MEKYTKLFAGAVACFVALRGVESQNQEEQRHSLFIEHPKTLQLTKQITKVLTREPTHKR